MQLFVKKKYSQTILVSGDLLEEIDSQAGKRHEMLIVQGTKGHESEYVPVLEIVIFVADLDQETEGAQGLEMLVIAQDPDRETAVIACDLDRRHLHYEDLLTGDTGRHLVGGNIFFKCIFLFQKNFKWYNRT